MSRIANKTNRDEFHVEYKGIVFESKMEYECYLGQEKGEHERNESEDFDDCMNLTDMIKGLCRGSTLFENLTSQKLHEFLMRFNRSKEVCIPDNLEDSPDEQGI